MTITRRLILVLGLFFLVLASRTVFFNRSLADLESQTKSLVSEAMTREEVAEGMTAAADQLALLTTSYVASPDPDLIPEMTVAREEFLAAHTAFDAAASDRLLSDAALTALRQFDDLTRQSQRIVDAVERRGRVATDGTPGELAAYGQAIDAYMARFQVLRVEIEATLDGVIAPRTDADVAAAEDAISSTISRTRSLSLMIGAVAGLIIIASIWMIERRIARPTRNLAIAAATLAQGGQPPPLPVVHDDELGRLTDVFNEMVRRQTESMRALGEANDEMTAQNERLRELDRLKDHFVATVSHELRTPLTSIVGYTELLSDGSVGELDPEQAQFIGVVARNANRLQRMVDDLLLAAKIDAGTLRLEKAPFDLGVLLTEAVESALPVAEDKGVQIVFSPIESVAFIGDRVRLGQAIDNLLNNAIKFTPPRGKVELKGNLTSSRATIVVSDSGMGIPEDEQARVFDRFYRSSTSGSVPGTGIGLSIVSFVANAHEGSVEVTSEMGVGSTFTMVLPRVNGHGAAPVKEVSNGKR